MDKRSVSADVRRRLVARSTRASARLERRVVPVDHVRSDKAERFIASLSART
jgi:hypothetical protein